MKTAFTKTIIYVHSGFQSHGTNVSKAHGYSVIPSSKVGPEVTIINSIHLEQGSSGLRTFPHDY